jgi:hypothetical protein
MNTENAARHVWRNSRSVQIRELRSSMLCEAEACANLRASERFDKYGLHRWCAEHLAEDEAVGRSLDTEWSVSPAEEPGRLSGPDDRR